MLQDLGSLPYFSHVAVMLNTTSDTIFTSRRNLQMSSNPLLKHRLPGRVFQLPSRGALYKNGELDPSCATGEIQIRPLSAMNEISLKNQDLLFNGRAIEDVVAECAPAIKKPLQLFSRDVDALLFYLRLVTYGNEFVVEVKHTCENATNHSYSINLDNMLLDMKFLDPSLVDSQRTFTLSSGEQVVVRPLLFQDMIEMLHMTGLAKNDLSVDDIKRLSVQNLLALIESVDGISDRSLIHEWIVTLTSPQIASITEHAENISSWGTNQFTTLTCKDCGEKMTVELPLNPVSFFTS